MLLKRIMAIILVGMMFIVGACSSPATPVTPAPPVTTPPVATPPITTPPVTTPPVTTPPVTTPPVVVPPPSSTVQGPNEVWTASNTFTPGVLTVSVGTNVVWTNKDSQVHTVVSDTGLFTATLGVGGSFNYTFTKAGDYEYNCDIHAGMAGAIHVQ